jgi:nucleoid DNA-binding protein
MNRSDLISILFSKGKLKEKDATAIVNLIFSGFTRALRKGDRVEIRGFRNFTVRRYDNRRNSEGSRGTEPKKLSFFRAGKGIKEKLNGGEEHHL